MLLTKMSLRKKYLSVWLVKVFICGEYITCLIARNVIVGLDFENRLYLYKIESSYGATSLNT